MAKDIQEDGKCTVSLVGFDELDEEEIEQAKKILSTHVSKLENKTDNGALKIRLKMHKHNKNFVHELEADFFVSGGKNFSANASDKNLYKALASTMSKLISEVEHNSRKEK